MDFPDSLRSEWDGCRIRLSREGESDPNRCGRCHLAASQDPDPGFAEEHLYTAGSLRRICRAAAQFSQKRSLMMLPVWGGFAEASTSSPAGVLLCQNVWLIWRVPAECSARTGPGSLPYPSWDHLAPRTGKGKLPVQERTRCPRPYEAGGRRFLGRARIVPIELVLRKRGMGGGRRCGDAADGVEQLESVLSHRADANLQLPLRVVQGHVV